MIQSINKLGDAVAQKGNKHANYVDLIRSYAHETETLFRQGGRIFNLYLSSRHEEVDIRLREILEGGLEKDRSLLNQMMQEMGVLHENFRQNIPGHRLRQTRVHFEQYLQGMRSYVTKNYKSFIPQVMKEAPHLTATAEIESKAIQEAMAAFRRTSRNMRYFLALPFSYGLAALGLGYILPKLEDSMTVIMTGETTHPGIKAARKYVLDRLKKQEERASWTYASRLATQSRLNGFFAQNA